MRDSLLMRINTLDEVDTTEDGYKLLTAYSKNDTEYLRKYISDIDAYQKVIPQVRFIDTCLLQPGLKDLKANEAYRFIYRQFFCPFEVNITICRFASSFNMHFVIYESKDDSLVCINVFDKPLSNKNWNEIVQSLLENDFWGRKKFNGLRGLDGSELTIIGYKKADKYQAEKYHHVYRWILLQENLMEALELALRMSENKDGCLTFKY